MKTKSTHAMEFTIAVKKNFAEKKQLQSAFIWAMLACCVINSNAQTKLGVNALAHNTTGTNNTAIGASSMFSNTDGKANTAIGDFSLYTNDHGNYNTASGYGSLNRNTSGSYNTAHGLNALYSNITGSNNMACGAYALQANTGGTYNTASGYASLNSNVTGVNNTASGYASLYSNKADNNTANGTLSLYSNINGSFNTAGGAYALYVNTNGSYNTATGYASLDNNSIGISNTATGYASLYNNKASNNTANGAQSLYSNMDGNDNTSIGYRSLYLNKSGSNNTAIGLNSLYNNTQGSGNTCIGSWANVASNNLTNATAIGYNAIATASNQVMLGNNEVTSIRLSSTTGNKFLEFFRPGTLPTQADWRFTHDGSGLFVNSSWNDFTTGCAIARFGTCGDTYKFTVYGNALASGGTWQTSDLKLKKSISEFNSAIDIIKQLKPKTYFFKTDEYNGLNLSVSKQYGFIAQDMEKVLPELVQTSQQPVRTNAAGERQMEDLKAVNYTELIPILTRAIQEQQQQIEELKEMVKKLSSQQSTTTTTIAESAKTNVAITNAFLEQNIPNPLTKTTSIRYNVPSGAKKAQLTISDNSGKTVKQIILNTGIGVVNIDASILSSGTYSYTLLIDGKLIESKKMVVAH